jgi:hypothetical protein
VIDAEIMKNLNDGMNKYGFSFELQGSRDWQNNQLSASNASDLILVNIQEHPDKVLVNNCINIYVLPAVSNNFSGGFVGTNKKVLLIGNTKTINHCAKQGSVSYEIAKGKVVAHEMGHCFGLPHTFGDDEKGEDGFSDTPIDYLTVSQGAQSCVTQGYNNLTQDCKFTGNICTSCKLASNPTYHMKNFMSYTTPNCMSYFSPQQVQYMRNFLESNLSDIIIQMGQKPAPSLLNIKVDNNTTSANTVNYISAGSHSIYTNIDESTVDVPLEWQSSNTGIYWYVYDTKNKSARFDLYSGQTTNFTIKAKNSCDSTTRTIGFYVQSAWRLASTQVASTFSVSFDDVSNTETLPQQMEIYDEATNKKEKVINVKQLHKDKAFKDKTLEVNISSITSGSKVLVFQYLKSKNSKGEAQYETKTDKIVRIAPRSENIEDDHTFRIYPTPVTSILQLEIFSKTKKNVAINMLNSLGAAVKQVNISLETGLNTNSIDVTDLTSGVYFLHSSDSEHTLNVLRFVKEEE